MAQDREILLRLCHAVPGRIRLKIPSLCRSEGVRITLKQWLEQTAGIQRVETRPVTGSVIVWYDIDGITPADFLKDLRPRLTDLMGQVLTSSHNLPPAAPVSNAHENRSSGLLGYYLLNGVALSAFMSWVLIRRFLFRSALSQSPLSLTGIVAMIGSIPLLWRTFHDLRQKKRIGLFPFLSVACVMAVIGGEALAALEILWVLSIGMLLEEYVAERARKGIRTLLEVTPEKTIVLRDGTEVETTTTDIEMNNTVVVHTGMKIPVDGTVLKGEALVDTSHMTGRSHPELCRSKDTVFAGTRLCEGSLFVRADKLGEDTFLAKIRHLVEEALSRPTEMEKRADLLASRLTRLGLLTTFLTFVLTRSLSRSFSVMLVMACPCATVLAASTAVAAAIANAARHQILIKGGIYLEQIPSIDTICFDKTGTLTTDVPHVTAVIPRVPRQNPDHIVQMAASAEIRATHPMARALTEEARHRNLELKRPDRTEVHLGRGVQVVQSQDMVLVGNREFLESKGMKVNYFKRKASSFRSSGQTVLYVAKNGRLQGIISVDNTPRPGLSSVLHRLRERGVSTFHLVSGDSERIVRAMAQTYSFDHYQGGLLPEEKSAFVERQVAGGRKVMMVGDGVNDALVLSKASVGVAMGAGGSEVAIEAADIALLKSDLEDLVILYSLGRHTLRIVEQNFWIATVTNLLGITLAVMGWMSPMLTGALHVVHSLGILMNSGRILRWKPDMGTGSNRQPALNFGQRRLLEKPIDA